MAQDVAADCSGALTGSAILACPALIHHRDLNVASVQMDRQGMALMDHADLFVVATMSVTGTWIVQTLLVVSGVVDVHLA